MDVCYLDTPLGITEIKGEMNGVSSILVQDKKISPTENIPKSLQDCASQLKEYFNGNLENFHFKLNLEGTDFQKRVWKELSNIPYGKTISYLELSKRLGDEKAIRAAAAANGKNPLWIVVPCHRVIGSDGSLTGYAGGLDRKKWLLEHEGAIKQMSLF